ncbi:MAG TPA: hypothetical protein VJT73_16225 [Polyangiaceae bacterium]|nr:hypothetical protein [Polyangiaceae bacterium]
MSVTVALATYFTTDAEAQIAGPERRLETGALQFGAALAAELLASPGAICPEGASVPCIIGSGGGLGVRIGYRFHAPWYLGVAYEFSKQDAHKSIYLAILQQVRGEVRYYLSQGAYAPFFTGGLGFVGYGSEWSLETAGAMAFAGVGLELEFSRTSVMAVMLTYRPILLTNWQDTSRLERPTGILSMIGIELALEQRSPVYQPGPP